MGVGRIWKRTQNLENKIILQQKPIEKPCQEDKYLNSNFVPLAATKKKKKPDWVVERVALSVCNNIV